MSAETVQVELGDRSYPVRIGAGLRHEALAVADQRLAVEIVVGEFDLVAFRLSFD